MRKPHPPPSGEKLPADAISPGKFIAALTIESGMMCSKDRRRKRGFIVHYHLGKLNDQEEKIIRNHETDPFL